MTRFFSMIHKFLLGLFSIVFLVNCTIEGSLSQRQGALLGADPLTINSVTHSQYFSSLSASPLVSWTLQSSAIPVDDFQIAVGLMPGLQDVQDWTSVGQVTSTAVTPLVLSEGTTYYAAVRARGLGSSLYTTSLVSSGWTVDTIPPTSPGVPADGALNIDLAESNLISWTASSDATSGISFYQLAIGSTPGGQEMLAWTNVGNNLSYQATGLNLVSGTTYYASLRAVDRAGNISAVSTSDGWLAGPYCSNKGSWLTYDSSGAGTDADPYLICNAAQLASIDSTPGSLTASYRLMGDIDFAPYYAAPNPQFMIENFRGKLHGNSFTISNFSYSAPADVGVGFFGSTNTGAEISYLVFVNANVSGGAQTGGLIGDSYSTKIHHVRFSGTVSSSSNYVGGFVGNSYHTVIGNSVFSGTVTAVGERVGGLVGQAIESSVYSSKATGTVTSTASSRVGGLAGYFGGGGSNRLSNSYSTANVSGGSAIGGLVGVFDSGGGILNSYATGSVSGTMNVAGLVGLLGSSSEIRNSYAVGSVSATSGAWVAQLVPASSGAVINSFYFSGSSCDSDGSGGVCSSAGTARGSLADFFNPTLPPLNSWDKTSSSVDGTDNYWVLNSTQQGTLWFEVSDSFISPFSLGTGSSFDPFVLTTASDFNLVGQNPRYLHFNFRLQSDIDFLSGTFQQIGGEMAPFSGFFDGGNFEISNIINNKPSTKFVGVFGVLAANGQISDLTISNVQISGLSEVGGLVGLLVRAHVENVIITSGSVSASGDQVGGIAGRIVKAGLFSVGTTLNVSGGSYVGGISGNAFSSYINGSFSKGSISGADYVGGIVGRTDGTNVDNSYSRGSVTASGIRVGGLAGETNSHFRSSYSSATVVGTSEVGGAFGRVTNATLSDVFAAGAISGTGGSTQVGVLFGTEVSSSVSNAWSWSGLTCDSTGAGGSCNTTGASFVGNVTDFHLSTNAPLSSWDFSTIWQTVGGDFPRLIFENN